MSDKLFYQIEVQDNGTLKVANFGRAIRASGDKADRATGKFHKLHTSLGGFDIGVGKVLKSLFSFKTLIMETVMALGLLKLERTIADWMKLAQAQELAEMQFRQAMITAGKYSEESYKNILRQAEAFQKLGIATDESILQGMKYLVTYKEITNDLLPRATKAMLDYSVFTGRSMEMSAKAVGKAAIGMTGELRRIGIQIGKNTFITRGFIGVLEDMEAQIGSQADVLSRTAIGRWIAYNSSVQTAKESIGEFFDAIFTHTGLLEEMEKNVDDLNKSLNEFKESGKLDTWALETADTVVWAFENMVWAVEEFYDALLKLGPAFEKVKGFFSLAWKYSPGNYIIQNFEKIKEEFNNIVNSMKDGYNKFLDHIVDITAEDFPEFATHLKKLIDKLKFSMDTEDIVKDTHLDTFKLMLDSIQERLANIRKNLHEHVDYTKAFNIPGYAPDMNMINPDTGFPGIRRITSEEPGEIEEISDAHAEKIAKAYEKMNDRIKELSLDSYEYEIYLLDKKKDEYQSLTLDQNKIDEWYFAERKNLLDEHIEEEKKEWESVSDSIESSFTSAFAGMVDNGFDSMKDFVRDVKRIFLELWTDKAITQPIIKPMIDQMSGLFGFLSGTTGYQPNMNMINPMTGLPAMTATKSAGIGNALGAGMLGYGITGGIGGGLGGMAGGFLGGQFLTSGIFQSAVGAAGAAGSIAPGALAGLGGPVGAILGGLVGTAITDMFKDSPKVPAVDILYDVIDGQIEKVSESWKNTGYDKELSDSISSFFERQIEFYKGLEIITGQKMKDMSFSISVGGSGDIKSMLEAGMTKEVLTKSLLNYPVWVETFGEQFTKPFQELYNETFGFYNPPLIQDVVGDKMAISYLFGLPSKKEKAEYMGKDYITDLILTGPVGGKWSDFLGGFVDEWEKITGEFGQSIGEAFLSTFETSGFQDFEQQFKRRIFENTVQGLTEAFMADAVTVVMGQTGVFQSMQGAGDLLGRYLAGEEGISIQDVIDLYKTGFSQINDAIGEVKPVFEAMQEGTTSLADALGLNTDALGQNTDALLGPIDSLIKDLTIGSLAPAQSLAGAQSEYDRLLAEAMMNPINASELAQYTRSGYLSTVEGAGEDYASSVGGIVADLTKVTEYHRDSGASARDIGQEVGNSLGPMLYDIKDSIAGQSITVVVKIGDKEIENIVIEALDNPDVAEKVKDDWRKNSGLIPYNK